MSSDPETDRSKSIGFARHALHVASHDPGSLANSVLALGLFGKDIGAMMALVDRALVLNPSFARGWYISAVLRLSAGEVDIAIEHANTSLRLSPRAQFGAPFAIIGSALFCNRRFDEALPKLLLAIQDLPSFSVPYRTLAACYAQMGRSNEAREVVARLRTITPLVMPNPNIAYFRKAEHCELFLAGLRIAIGETT